MRDVSDNQQWAAPGASQPPPPVTPPSPPAPPALPPVPGSPQGWTPPPKPGLVPLRPMTLGTILAASFQVMRRNPRTTILPALGLAIISALAAGGGVALVVGSMSRVFTTTSVGDQGALAAGTLLLALLVGVVAIALVLVATAILQALIVTEIARGTVGERQTFGQAWARAKGRIGAVIGYAVLLVVAILVVFVVLIAIFAGAAAGISATSDPSNPGAFGAIIGVILLGEFAIFAIGGVLWAWLSTKLAFVPSAIVLERLSIGGGIARSWRLTRGAFWRTFGILLLVGLMVGVATSIITTPVQFIAFLGGGLVDPTGVSSSDPSAFLTSFLISSVAIYVVQAFVSSLGMVLQASTASLLYLDSRMRKEGLDLELARYVEARQTGADLPDPFLPRSA